MTVTGAIHISQALMVKRTLWKLNVTDNNFGDEGVIAIAKALVNSDICLLYVCKCGITLNGAETLAQVLPTYHNIEELWLYGNAITVNGARLIMRSAIYDTKCEAVWVNPIYENDNDVEKLINVLDKRVIATTHKND